MVNNRISAKARRVKYAVLVFIAVTVMLFASVFAVCRFVPTATAEGACTVTVHVYDPTSGYDSIAGWFWVKNGSGTEYQVSGVSSEFEKSYESGGSTVTNKARTFTVNFNEADTAKLKSGIPMGLLICKSTGGSGEFWNRYEKETADVFVDLSAALTDGNNANIYYIRKDTVAFTDIEGAKMALEKVTGARFTQKTSSYVTVEFETTSPIVNGTEVTIVNGKDTVATSTAQRGSSEFSGTAKFTQLNGSNFDFSADYVLKVGKIPTGASISKTQFIDDADFISTFESVDTQNAELGALYTAEKTTFRLWAPFSSQVKVNLYRDGSKGEAFRTIIMEKRLVGGKWGGIWQAESSGDLKGTYYTYSVNNYGSVTEAMDPYAKACGANGNRAMVVDLDSTDPVGWSNDAHLYKKNASNADTPIVWEVHVKDFSASSDSGMVNKGKYLAFTEKNTTVPGEPTLKTGISYLKDLGITYVHLNPVYDFATVDESDPSVADNTKDAYNWGYDPQNYNIPEGSYSTDAARGDVRVNEFKQMVMALHNEGIGVIMDVVYNHTFATSNQALNDTAPMYYHRTNENGSFTNGSGCGNETASERTMMRKYIVESIVYWATEYHVDGFRFDLMGVHDNDTMTAIRNALDNLDNGNGKKLLMYGEPWSGDGKDYVPPSFTARVNATSMLGASAGKYAPNKATNHLIKTKQDSNYNFQAQELADRVAVFNGKGRDGIRGNNDPGQGWINGNVGEYGQVQKMLEGGCGGTGGGYALKNGTQNVAYAAAHDNYTLWDQMIGKKAGTETPLFYDAPIDYYMHMCETASSAYLMSSGISFILAGEEIGRTKYGNHNSYNSPTKVNQIVWSRQKQFAELYSHYKQAIAVRKAYRSEFFSYELAADPAKCYGDFTGTDMSGVIRFTRTSSSGQKLICVFNPTDAPVSISTSGMRVYLLNGKSLPSSTQGTVEVSGKCTLIMGTKTI